MKNFLSCDWGTSSFRLRYVEPKTLKFIAVENQDQGIANRFDLWKKSGKDEQERFLFYRDNINKHIGILQQELNVSLQHIPLVISGMASSSIGMVNLPYKELPAKADGSDLVIKIIPASAEFMHEMIIVSGVKKDDDVIRGEETQLAGCEYGHQDEEIFIFPGTHSKHIIVNKGRVIDFKTYMTGEFFELLSRKSILSASVEQGEGIVDKQNLDGFEAGVYAGCETNLLHSSFIARTNHLFEKFSRQENYYYLSGLLIGTEIGELKMWLDKKITLVVDEKLKPYYTSAFKVLGLEESSGLIVQDADRALINGQLRISRRHLQ